MARILIVDDDSNIRYLIKDFLSPFGHQLDEAVNGADALERIKKSHYDLVIMDRAMPQMTGLQALLKLRADVAQKKIKVLMCTSMSLTKQVDEAFRSGADDYIAKPFDLELLAQKVARLTKPGVG